MAQQVVYSIISEDFYGGATGFHRIFASLEEAKACAERFSEEKNVDYCIMRVIIGSSDPPTIVGSDMQQPGS